MQRNSSEKNPISFASKCERNIFFFIREQQGREEFYLLAHERTYANSHAEEVNPITYGIILNN
jgi:hypothetical protein